MKIIDHLSLFALEMSEEMGINFLVIKTRAHTIDPKKTKLKFSLKEKQEKVAKRVDGQRT